MRQRKRRLIRIAVEAFTIVASVVLGFQIKKRNEIELLINSGMIFFLKFLSFIVERI